MSDHLQSLGYLTFPISLLPYVWSLGNIAIVDNKEMSVKAHIVFTYYKTTVS